MTYSVKWEQTDAEFANRFDKYLDYRFAPRSAALRIRGC